MVSRRGAKSAAVGVVVGASSLFIKGVIGGDGDMNRNMMVFKVSGEMLMKYLMFDGCLLSVMDTATAVRTAAANSSGVVVEKSIIVFVLSVGM